MLLIAASLIGCGNRSSLAQGESPEPCLATNVPVSNATDVQVLAKKTTNWVASLDQSLRQRAQYCLGDPEQHAWTNVPGRRSGGIRLGDQSEMQQDLVWNVLDGFLSDEGFWRAQLIATDIEVASGAGPTADYTVALFGDPSVEGAWGFQFDGHHLALNFVVHGDDVILAPAFIGTQPLSVGNEAPLGQATELGRSLIAMLNANERDLANAVDLLGRDVHAGSGRGQDDRGRLFDVNVFDGIGAPISALSESSKSAIVEIQSEYINNLSEPFAGRVRTKLESMLDAGFFAFEMDGERMYYRIYVPNGILIEYNDVSEDHIHTVTRLLGSDALSDYGMWADVQRETMTIEEHHLLAEHHQRDLSDHMNHH